MECGFTYLGGIEMKKTEDPLAYWAERAEVLATKNQTLYQDTMMFQFQKWDRSSLAYARQLAATLIHILGNPNGYAHSTYLAGIRKAIKQRERDLRKAKRRSAA